MRKYEANRRFMKSSISDYNLVTGADIANGVPQPPFQKPIPEDSELADLQQINSNTAPKADFFTCTSSRISRRAYSVEPMSINELSFLLWCTQGVKKVISGYRAFLKDGSGRNYLRPVATGGSIPSYETYLAINNVSDIERGIWKYLPLSNKLLRIKNADKLPEDISNVFTNPCQDQSYASRAAAVFFWVCRPYYGEWKYEGTAHKIMLIDVGHISHQLYLAAEALGLGAAP
jgi:SagB-type dehydrogenase family enzyme